MPTETQSLQNELLQKVQEIYDKNDDLSEVELKREGLMAYLLKGFHHGFSSAYVSLDSSRPWLVYWSLHSLDLLGYELNAEEIDRSIESIAKFQVTGGAGGFCGGDFSSTAQIGLLAATYAAVLSLAVLAEPRGYDLIDRPALRSFLKRLKCPDGSFRMHAVDGEIDVRAAYCAVVVGKLTGCWDEELEEGLVKWISSCQTWEGGFAGVPGSEAHGGYTFCAIAALSLLQSDPNPNFSCINLPNLLYWLTSQQDQDIGGFRGRTNKLVDGCYSFWQAAAFESIGYGNLLDSAALQRYILLACQDSRGNGLRDKPGASPDFYHTCYCLSGLSLAQHQLKDPEFILGGPTNLLKAVDARYNLVRGKADAMQQYFSLKQ